MGLRDMCARDICSFSVGRWARTARGGEQAAAACAGGRRATETPRERDLILPKESYTPDAIALPALVYTAAAHAHNGSLYPCSVHTIHLGLRASLRLPLTPWLERDPEGVHSWDVHNAAKHDTHR